MWVICLAVMVSDMAYQGDTAIDDLDKKETESIIKQLADGDTATKQSAINKLTSHWESDKLLNHISEHLTKNKGTLSPGIQENLRSVSEKIKLRRKLGKDLVVIFADKIDEIPKWTEVECVANAIFMFAKPSEHNLTTISNRSILTNWLLKKVNFHTGNVFLATSLVWIAYPDVHMAVASSLLKEYETGQISGINFDWEIDDMIALILRVVRIAKVREGAPLVSSYLNHKNILVKVEAIRTLGALNATRYENTIADLFKQLTADRVYDAEKETILPPVIEALGMLGSKSIKEQIISILDNSIAVPDSILKSAMIAISHFGAKEASDKISMFLTNPSEELRSEACLTLAKLEGSKHVPEIAKLMQDKSPDVRASAIKALGALRIRKYTDQMTQALEQNHWEVRKVTSAAIEALAHLGSKEHIDRIGPFLDARSDNAGLQGSAMYALGKLGAGSYSDKISSFLNIEYKNNISLAGEAIRALGKIGDKKSIEAILKCYREMEFRTTVYSETRLDWDSRNSREIIEEVLKELGMDPPQNNKK